MSVRSQGDTKGASQPEIGQLEITVLVDQQVLRLEVTMQDTVSVEVVDSFHELVRLFITAASLCQREGASGGERVTCSRISGREDELLTWSAFVESNLVSL